MKNFKRILAMMSAAAVVTGCLAGCGQNEETAKESQSTVVQKESSESSVADSKTAEEVNGELPLDYYAGTTLRIATMKEITDLTDSVGDKAVVKALEEATGIHIEWIEIPKGSESEKLSVMFADPKSMPDAFLGFLVTETMIASNMGLFYDLSEEGLLETYASNVLADIETLPDGLEMLRWSDGSIRSLPTGPATSYNNAANGIWYINKDWLDQLGMDVPATAEEFYEAMLGFKENDMNGNGDTTDEIPLCFAEANWAGHFMNLTNPWGIAGTNDYYKVENGVVKGTSNTPEFRACLEYYNRLAKEGLLDVEGFSQTTDQYFAKLKENRVGCFVAWLPQSAMDPEMSAQYVAMAPFTAMEGVEPVKTGQRDRLQADKFGFVVSANCSNVEALLHWWNYASSSTEMKYMFRYGEQGIGWDIVDGQFVSVDPTEEQIAASGIPRENFSISHGFADQAPLIRSDEVMQATDANSLFRKEAVDLVYEYLPTEVVPNRIVPAEFTEERVFMEMELLDVIKHFTADSVVNGITDESWNNYVEQLENLDYDSYIQWWQDKYDGNF